MQLRLLHTRENLVFDQVAEEQVVKHEVDGNEHVDVLHPGLLQDFKHWRDVNQFLILRNLEQKVHGESWRRALGIPVGHCVAGWVFQSFISLLIVVLQQIRDTHFPHMVQEKLVVVVSSLNIICSGGNRVSLHQLQLSLGLNILHWNFKIKVLGIIAQTFHLHHNWWVWIFNDVFKSC